MRFANPEVLWALPLAALPYFIHLLSRRAAKAVNFSDLTLLRAIETAAKPRARLKDLFLLLMRTLLIISLVAAAAGPMSKGSPAGANEGLDVVVLLDASLSMRARDAGQSRFDAARDAGRGLLRKLAPGDRVAFAAFDVALRSPLEWTDPSLALAALNRVEAGFRGTDAGAALESAKRLLVASPPGRRRAVVVLGDGAGHMIGRDAPPPAEGATVLGLKFPEIGNSWIVDARAVSDTDERGAQLEVRLASNARAAPRDIDLWIGDSRGASVSASPGVGAQARAVLSLPKEANSLAPAWSGKVSQRIDALSEDDTRYFSVRRSPAPRALILYGDPAFDRAGRAGWSLRALFGGVDRNLTDRDADFLPSSRWSEAELARYGTVVLPDAAALPSGLVATLEKFAANGGGVWVIPGAGAAGSDLNSLSSWLPARIGPPQSQTAGDGVRVAADFAIAKEWDSFALKQVSFHKLFRLEPRPQADVRLTDAGGAPLLVDGAVGRGRAVVWAVPLDASWSNLSLKPLFVSWARACLSLTVPAGGQSAPSAYVGDKLVKIWRADEAAPDRVSVHGPDGFRAALSVRSRRAELPAALRPGLYEFVEPGGASTAFAVNVDVSRGESDLTAIVRPPWRETDPPSLAADFFTEIYGRRREGWFFGLAAAAVALEMLFALPVATAAAATASILFLLCAAPAGAQQGDRFVWTQLRLGAGWDPYPDAPQRAMALLQQATSARVALQRRILALDDPTLFSSPFVYLAGNEAPPELSEAERRRLRQYLTAGGFLWIEDSTGGPPGSFDAWVRRNLPQLLPGVDLRPLPSDHVLMRTFFLLRAPAGRVRVQGALEGAVWNGKLAVFYTRDDVLGAWALDALGKPLFHCVPGGETQREDARRETLNVLMYTMTGSYKADAVHQAAILEKLRRIGP